MKKRALGNSDLMVSPLVFGGNVFGWTVDEAMSFRLLDTFVDHGFNLIDTANLYSNWAPGNKGGESETIIGKWLKRSGKRDKVIIATKVGHRMTADQNGLKKEYIFEAVEDSLQRLQLETIDLYQSHVDDLSTPVEETLRAFDDLVRSGKVRAIGASQFSPERLRESLEVSRDNGLVSYCSLQPLYNLYDRENFEVNLEPICREFNLGVINFYSLAAGFLTGKYRTESDLSKSVRGMARIKESYFNEKGHKLIRALDIVSKKLNAPISSVAIAWIMNRSTITAPIASATNLDQLGELIRSAEIVLDSECMTILNEASAYD